MMLNLRKDKLFIVLLILLAITVLSWLLLYSVAMPTKIIGALLLLLAFVKVQLIISQYMELYKAILPIRFAFWLWTVIVCAISIGVYFP